MQYRYTVIRSARRTAAIQIKNAKILVRVPETMTNAEIRRFVSDHTDWIVRNMKREETARRAGGAAKLTPEELEKLAEQARTVIPERVRHYAPIAGVTVNRITIRNQTTRWGSCSAAGNLNFNCLLMLTPLPVVDSVVVHELCHRLYMNHSKAFYAEVRRVYPEYDKWNAWLKKHGGEIMARNPACP